MRKCGMGMAVLATALFAMSARAEHTRMTNPTVLGVEALGRGFLYSVFFDRVMDDQLSAGFGFSSLSTTGGGSTAAIPAYFNFYFMKEQGSLYATGGVTILTNASAVNGSATSTGSISLNGNSVLPVFGVGYENRTDSGYLFRVTGYGIVAATVNLWGGFSFGYAF